MHKKCYEWILDNLSRLFPGFKEASVNLEEFDFPLNK